jgi:site-specific recombinase XerD
VTRKRIAVYGHRGALVRVFQVHDSKGTRYVVQWGSKAARQQRSFLGKTGKVEAIAFAEAFHDESKKPAVPEVKAPITTRQLWLSYCTATFPHLRPRTKQLYAEFWKHWEQFYRPETPAGDLTHEDCTGFRAELERQGLATATIQKTIVCVRGVYNYAERVELIDRNRWHAFRFKVAKERRTKPRAEYRDHEFAAIWKQLDPTDRWQWRAYVAIGLLGLYGVRQNALLHLRWPDVIDDQFTLVSEFDKQGEEHVLPMTDAARTLFAIARAWREREGYTGEWVFFTGRAMLTKGETYTIQSLWAALKAAEKAAGIEPVRYRAGHGFRRGLVGDLLASGVDLELALKAIGDKDLRMGRHYAIKRNERIEKAFTDRAEQFSGASVGATQVQPSPESTTAAPSGETERPHVNHHTTEGYTK